MAPWEMHCGRDLQVSRWKGEGEAVNSTFKGLVVKELIALEEPTKFSVAEEDSVEGREAAR